LHQFLENRFRLLVAAAVILMVVLQIVSVRRESQTYDEGVHLASGYRYWLTRDFSMNVEHPPLQKLLSAAMLLPLRPPMPTDEKLLTDQSEYARAFLYSPARNADTLFLLGRLPTIAFSALLAIAIAIAARRFFSPAAALAAVWLLCLDPNILAHGRYITTDLSSALFFFLAVILWVSWCRTPSRPLAIWTAVALGLALGSKFSLVILLPLLPLLLLIHTVCERWAFRPWLVLAGIVAGAILIVAILYAPESWRVFRGRPIHVSAETLFGVRLFPHSYWTGLRTVLDHNREGHPAFLLGKVSEAGWWYYFPVVFAVKSSTALLLLTLSAAGIALWKLPRLRRDPRATFLWLALAAAPIVYFGVTLSSRLNLGVRHILPVYPFLYLLGAAALAAVLSPKRFMIAAGLLIGVQASENAVIFPDYLGFFNTPAGGVTAGPRYLLDSNLDWGQDLKKLKEYVDRTATPVLCLEYFGSADPNYYGIRYEYLPRTWDADERARANCIGAISVTVLNDVYMKPGSYEWLRQKKPIGIVGSSIYLYDLRRY